MSQRIDIRRLILKVERAALDRLNIRTLLVAADAALAALRRELRLARALARRAITKPLRLKRSK